MPAFFRDEDYQAYFDLTEEWCGKSGVEIWAYCLMSNHVHLTLGNSPPRPTPLRQFVASKGITTQYFGLIPTAHSSYLTLSRTPLFLRNPSSTS